MTTKGNLTGHHWRVLGNRAMILKSVSKKKELIIYPAFSLLTVPPHKAKTGSLTFKEVFQLISEERLVDFEYHNFGPGSVVSC